MPPLLIGLSPELIISVETVSVLLSGNVTVKVSVPVIPVSSSFIIKNDPSSYTLIVPLRVFPTILSESIPVIV